MNGKQITVIGGGLSGLCCATLLARGGREVTLYEKAKVGGRATTAELHGALLNQGPHALYRGGRAMAVLRSLGVEPQGRTPPTSGLFAWRDGRLYGLPAGAVSLLSTGLLDLPAKLELGRLLARLGSLKPIGSVREWLQREVKSTQAREVLAALFRVSTYVNDDRLPARLALDQLRLAAEYEVLYLDGGWQTLVDAVKAKALEAGVRIVEHEKRGPRAGGETVLAVPPGAELFEGRFAHLQPVRAACLDVVLSRLPRPRHYFALGIDQPLYFSLHSRTAKLGPHHVISAAKYLAPDDDGATALAELEALTDAMQPGWRDHGVAKRYLPQMVVMYARPDTRPAVDAMPGAWLCGDWVGEEGMLLDCALASAAEVSRRILARVTPSAAAA
ncbi:MAG: FAD-dependent oxidoreductase [Archangiaceae bacterium]|nr:FAD-dependent oxidoreductase [Archangiaceae bacterium]